MKTRRIETKAVLKYLFWFAAVVISVALTRHSAHQGNDFEVFWKAARFTLSGESPYDVIRDGPNVFKYPPWILPFFFPFAFLPLVAAKWIWGFLQPVSILAAGHWLLERGCRAWLVAVSALLCWGLWAVHAMDGQVNLVILAVSLWAAPLVFNSKSSSAFFVTAISLTTKVFSVLPLIFLTRHTKWKKTLPRLLLICGLLSLPVIIVSDRHSPVEMMDSWIGAAQSGGSAFGDQKVRGRDNQGFPALVLRKFQIHSDRVTWDLGLFAFFALVLGGAWFYFSGTMHPISRWIGWLALIPLTHPLAWFHMFVFAFPLLVFSLESTLRSKRRAYIALSIAGFVLTALVTRKTFGELGIWLESFSVKSWGVCLSMVAWVLASRRHSSGRRSKNYILD